MIVAAEAPWWSTPAFTLGGIVIGLLGGYYIDRWKAKREDSLRWKDQVRASAARFLVAANDFRDAAYGPRGVPQEGLNDRAQAMGAAFADLVLVAPSVLVDAASDVSLAASDTDLFQDHPDTAFAKYDRARMHFVQEARKDLGTERLVHSDEQLRAYYEAYSES
jgi:hypothetical protein